MAQKARDDRAERHRVAKEKLRTYLKTKGLRSTRQRDVILESFLDQDAHTSVEELYDRVRRTDPSVGHATVYRSMNLFVDAGIAKERRFHEGCVRYEPGVNVGHHDHLVCVRCGNIQEFEDPTIEQIQREVAVTRGFLVRYHRLELYGLCPRCRSADEAEGAPS